MLFVCARMANNLARWLNRPGRLIQGVFGRADGKLDILERMDGLTFEVLICPFGSVDVIEQLKQFASEKFHREMFQASIRTAEHEGGV